MTRGELEQFARDRWEESFAYDSLHAEALAAACLGSAVWCWSALTVCELRALAASLFSTVLRSRG